MTETFEQKKNKENVIGLQRIIPSQIRCSRKLNDYNGCAHADIDLTMTKTDNFKTSC